MIVKLATRSVRVNFDTLDSVDAPQLIRAILFRAGLPRGDLPLLFPDEDDKVERPCERIQPERLADLAIIDHAISDPRRRQIALDEHLLLWLLARTSPDASLMPASWVWEPICGVWRASWAWQVLPHQLACGPRWERPPPIAIDLERP